MLDKRYQVFVSSTYEDLREERTEVMQALLELNCIPAGMELFPASDEDSWTLIKRVIDECDYYIVIIAGRYGSTNDEGVSYTEMEYRYALSKEKPVIGFVHRDPGKISLEKSEQTPNGRQKLEAFEELVKQKTVRSWADAKELGSVVSRSMIQLIRSRPAVGWVRADSVPDVNASQEILRLQKENEMLRRELRIFRVEGPENAKLLSRGDDLFPVRYTLEVAEYVAEDEYHTHREAGICEMSWNRIISAIGPRILVPMNESDIRASLSHTILKKLARMSYRTSGLTMMISRRSKFNCGLLEYSRYQMRNGR